MSRTVTSTPEKSSVVHLFPKRRRVAADDQTSIHGSAYSSKELHSWTFSTESIACCTIHDAFTMKQNTVDDYDFFWLGRIPCRTVEIVGIVVGLKVTERKIVYSVDDGTGVIDCDHLHRDRPAEPPTKQISKYQRPETHTLPELPKPLADIGQTIRVIGTVRPWYETRIIYVNHLHLCASPNEELLHLQFVRDRHRTWYFSETPFIIPSQSTKTILETPIKKKVQDVPSTGISNAPSSVSSSPIKSSPLHDEKKSILKSPPKLRHPSRLHTHDLTENTFRIYIKHYMDHATTPHSSPDYDSDDDVIAKSLEKAPSTPTKRSRSTQLLDLNTPRPRYSITTPKASRFRSGESKSMEFEAKEPRLEGYTLSYLRRVPELSLLATRVVQAVAKRREREERKRLKEAGVISSSKPPPLASAPILADKFAGKVKRLFQWAVIQLLREGCIILWDGAVRRFPDSENKLTDMSRLWKTCTNPHGDYTIFSASLPDSLIDIDSLSGYLSDPQPNEESYISLTPAYLAPYVERAVKVLVEHYARNGKPYAGATTEGILSVLKKDDRWRHIGAWSVQDALEVLGTECKVWDMGKGRWDLTV